MVNKGSKNGYVAELKAELYQNEDLSYYVKIYVIDHISIAEPDRSSWRESLKLYNLSFTLGFSGNIRWLFEDKDVFKIIKNTWSKKVYKKCLKEFLATKL